MPENQRTLDSDTVMTDEANRINTIFEPLSAKLLSDEEIEKISAAACLVPNTSRLLSSLAEAFDEACTEAHYNRYAQANIARIVLALLKNRTHTEAPEKPSVEEPQSPGHRIGKMVWQIVRYPIFIFGQLFGYLNNTINTYTSLDRSFWRGLFPHASISLLITLPIDLIFIFVTLIQYRRFEISLLKVALGLSHHREVDPSLVADRTTIKVTRLINEELARQKTQTLLKNGDMNACFAAVARQFSLQVVEKKKKYVSYTEPKQQKVIRWGFNVIGAFLISCFTAFSFKYTIVAFATSVAVAAWLPWLGAALAVPAIMTALTCCAVASSLIYYASKRRNSPNHYFHKFTHNQKKLDAFEKSWTLMEKNQHHEEVIYRQTLLSQRLQKKETRSTYNKVLGEIRRIHIRYRENIHSEGMSSLASQAQHASLLESIRKHHTPCSRHPSPDHPEQKASSPPLRNHSWLSLSHSPSASPENSREAEHATDFVPRRIRQASDPRLSDALREDSPPPALSFVPAATYSPAR